MARGCLLQELHCYRIVYMFVSSGLVVSITSPSVVSLNLLISEIVIIMYCLRLFNVVLQEHFTTMFTFIVVCGVVIETCDCTKFNLDYLWRQ